MCVGAEGSELVLSSLLGGGQRPHEEVKFYHGPRPNEPSLDSPFDDPARRRKDKRPGPHPPPANHPAGMETPNQSSGGDAACVAGLCADLDLEGTAALQDLEGTSALQFRHQGDHNIAHHRLAVMDWSSQEGAPKVGLPP